MARSDEEHYPDDLREVAELLRTHKATGTPLELDRIKRRAIAQASRERGPERRRTVVPRSRMASLLLVVGLVGGAGVAGVIADPPSGGKRGDEAQYRPGKGCGRPDRVPTGPRTRTDEDCPRRSRGRR
jgi:hypothetical protein